MGMRRCQEVGGAQSLLWLRKSSGNPCGSLMVLWVLGRLVSSGEMFSVFLFEDCNSWKSHFPKRSFLGYGFWGFLFCFVLFLRFLSELVMTVPENHSLLY